MNACTNFRPPGMQVLVVDRGHEPAAMRTQVESCDTVSQPQPRLGVPHGGTCTATVDPSGQAPSLVQLHAQLDRGSEAEHSDV